jgi:ribosome-binding factor A
MSEYSRTQRIGDALRQELAILIRDSIRDPRVGLASITDAVVTKDLGYAKVYVTFVGKTDEESEKAIEVLNGAAGFLRNGIAKSMQLRATPKLSFFYDRSVRAGETLEALIEKVVHDDKKRHVDDEGEES